MAFFFNCCICQLKNYVYLCTDFQNVATTRQKYGAGIIKFNV